jgi:two-component system sensor histidine kinase UhpB
METTLVLIVEDDVVDRMACRRTLAGSQAGRFRLIEADDGAHGLQMAIDFCPDCILLEHRLPDLSGFEFLACLGAHEDERIRAIPVLMLTGADSAVVAAEAMRRGARDYLVKDAEGRYLELVPAAIERVQREQRLLLEKRRAEAKFRTLVEQTQAISYIVSEDFPDRLDYISPQIAMLGYTAAEWVARGEGRCCGCGTRPRPCTTRPVSRCSCKVPWSTSRRTKWPNRSLLKRAMSCAIWSRIRRRFARMNASA